MDKIKKFLKSEKMKKMTQFIKDYWYIFVIGIAVAVYIITYLSTNNKPAPCPPGQSLQCDPQKCLPNCATDQFYACDINSCIPKCNDDQAVIKCGTVYKCVPKDPKSANFEIPAFDETNCKWVSGYNSKNCKLSTGEGSNKTFYEDCVSWNDSSSNKYGSVKFGNTSTNGAFKCGIPGDNETGIYNKFTSEQHRQGDISYNVLKKGDTYPESFSNSCGSKSSFTSIQSSTNDDDLNSYCINSSGGLYNNSGNRTSDKPTGNPFCGYDSPSQTCKQSVNCDNPSSGSKNYSWEQYASMNNCESKLVNGQAQPVNKNKDCTIPAFMFPLLGDGTCDVTSLGTNCILGNTCDDWIGGYNNYEKSCNYDSSGCKTSIDASGSIISTCDQNDIKGCRTDKLHVWSGTQCVTQFTGDIIIGVSGIKINQSKQSNPWVIWKLKIMLDTLPSGMDQVIKNTKNISNIDIYIAEINNQQVDIINQVYFKSVDDINSFIEYSSSDNSYILGNGFGTTPLFINDTPQSSGDLYKTLTKGKNYYMGLTIYMKNDQNQITFKTRGFNLNGITNIEKNSFTL